MRSSHSPFRRSQDSKVRTVVTPSPHSVNLKTAATEEDNVSLMGERERRLLPKALESPRNLIEADSTSGRDLSSNSTLKFSQQCKLRLLASQAASNEIDNDCVVLQRFQSVITADLMSQRNNFIAGRNVRSVNSKFAILSHTIYSIYGRQ